MTHSGSFAFAMLSAISLAGQTPAPAPAAQPPVQQQPFRASTLLVEVDTIVTDAKGQFVTGMTADDFEVLEEGKPQTIERIYVVTGGTVTAPSARPSATATGEAAPTPLPAGAPPRVFVLLFDRDHLQTGAFKRLQDAAIAFLTNEFKPGDVGGVVIGNTMAGNQLTSDREALLAAVRNAQPTAAKTSRRLELLEWPRFNSEAEAVRVALFNDHEVTAQIVRRACQDDPGLCKVDPEPMVMEKARTIVGDLRPAARQTVATLQALATGLARLPGRKTIILMTEGFFIEESWADLRQIVGAAAGSNVRVYSLDARGIDTRQINDPHQLSVMDPGGSMPIDAYNTAEDGPNMLAVDTGGYPIRHTNNFAEALSEIARDTSSYYVIGYRPADPAADGSFRRIVVRVKRRGLTVRARRGYLAAPSGTDMTAPPRTAPTATPQPEPRVAAHEELTPTPASSPAADPARIAAPGPAERKEAPAVTLRPDSNDRVRELASSEGGTDAARSLASQGWSHYQTGDLDGAAKLLGQAAADSNARPWVHYALGYAELGLRHPDKAAQAWERVYTSVPEFRPVYLDLADAYFQMENYSRASRILKEAETRWPGDTDVLNAMGTIQVRRGALDDAIGTFRRATDANPRDALAYFNLARTYELRYFKTRRYSQTEARWLANPADVKNAIASYEQYVKLGGPYETQARQAVQNLQWIKAPAP